MGKLCRTGHSARGGRIGCTDCGDSLSGSWTERVMVDRPAFWAEPPLRRWWSWWCVPELVAVFAIGVCLANFLYVGPGICCRDQVGVPGNDSYYHVKMALLLPETGLLDEFPWLERVWFTESGDAFVSHHYGFHLLLAPFVHAGQWLIDDPLTGGRWAMAALLGASFALFQLILMTQGVRCRWLWLGLLLLLPLHFYTRQTYVRAIGPSLVFMLLILLLLFRRRYAWVALALAGYIHLYFGGVVFGPLIVICYAVAGLLGPRGDRVSWRLWVWAAGGWVLGLITHPYAGGMREFLLLQVFGTGLTPDISVGREWRSYQDVWTLATSCAWVLVPLALAMALRLRRGPAARAPELATLLLSLVLAGLMLKARRFIEYWPPFGLLAAALLAAPVLNGIWERVSLRLAESRSRGPALTLGLVLMLAGAVAIIGCGCCGSRLAINPLVREWRLWALLFGVYLLAPLTRFWITHRPAGWYWRRVLVDAAVPLAAAAVAVGAVAVLLRLVAPIATADRALFFVPWWCFALLGLVYTWTTVIARRQAPSRALPQRWHRGAGLAVVAVAGVVGAAALTATAGPHLVQTQRSIRTKFNLNAIRAALAWLQDNSAPDSVIFTDDWDVFPVYFYMNHHNRYCVGLDPKFTHDRDPVLWARYVKITRGLTPASVKVPARDGAHDEPQSVKVRLEDIRDHFGADYVIVDQDHDSLRRKLTRAATFCERVYPSPAPGAPGPRTDRLTSDAPYVIFRVFSRAEQEARHRPEDRDPTAQPTSRPTTPPEDAEEA